LLSAGEHVIRRERQHWLALLLDSRAALGVWLVALLILVVLWLIVPSLSGTGRSILNYVFTGAVVIGAVIFIFRWWQWRTEEYLVTNRRLLKVSGIVNKVSGDSSLEKINDAVLFENLLGRILNYGDLDILTAAEVAVDRYRMLNHAKQFKKEMFDAKHAIEHEVAYVEMPSPPLRTDTPGGTPASLPTGSATMDTTIVASTATPIAAAAPAAAAAMADQPPPVVTTPPPPAEAVFAPLPVADAPPPVAEASPPVADSTAPDDSPVDTEDVGSTDDDAVASADDAPPAAAAEPAAAGEPLGAAEPPTSAIDTPDEVMQALTRLADLRDHGAITSEEYEEKKQELLGRL
jgi:hypothetical protein